MFNIKWIGIIKDENYHIYTEGKKFEYDNVKRVVESNEILVAIKH